MKRVIFTRGTYFRYQEPPINPFATKNRTHRNPLKGVYHNTKVLRDDDQRIDDMLCSSELYATMSAKENNGLPLVAKYVVSGDTFYVLNGRIFSEHTALGEKIAVPVYSFDYLLRETARVQMIVDGVGLQPSDFEVLQLEIGTLNKDGVFTYGEYSKYLATLEGARRFSAER